MLVDTTAGTSATCYECKTAIWRALVVCDVLAARELERQFAAEAAAEAARIKAEQEAAILARIAFERRHRYFLSMIRAHCAAENANCQSNECIGELTQLAECLAEDEDPPPWSSDNICFSAANLVVRIGTSEEVQTKKKRIGTNPPMVVCAQDLFVALDSIVCQHHDECTPESTFCWFKDATTRQCTEAECDTCLDISSDKCHRGSKDDSEAECVGKRDRIWCRPSAAQAPKTASCGSCIVDCKATAKPTEKKQRHAVLAYPSSINRRESCKDVCDSRAKAKLDAIRNFYETARLKSDMKINVPAPQELVADGPKRNAFVDDFAAWVAEVMGDDVVKENVIVKEIHVGDRRRALLSAANAKVPSRFRRRLGEASGVTVDYEVEVPLSVISKADAMAESIATEVAAGSAVIGDFPVTGAGVIETPVLLSNSKLRAGMRGSPSPKLYSGGVEEFENGVVCHKENALGGGNLGMRYSCRVEDL